MQIKLTASDAAEDITYVKTVLDAKTQEEELSSIRRWLHTDGIESEARFIAALSQRCPSTGVWLLQSKKFREWMAGNHDCMWLFGIGKMRMMRCEGLR